MTLNSSPFAIPDQVDTGDTFDQSANVYQHAHSKAVELHQALVSIEDLIPRMVDKEARIIGVTPGPFVLTSSTNTFDWQVALSPTTSTRVFIDSYRRN